MYGKLYMQYEMHVADNVLIMLHIVIQNKMLRKL